MSDVIDEFDSGADHSDANNLNPNPPVHEAAPVLNDDGSFPDCESADEESVTEENLETGLEHALANDEVEDGDLGLLDPANLAPSDRDFAPKFRANVGGLGFRGVECRKAHKGELTFLFELAPLLVLLLQGAKPNEFYVLPPHLLEKYRDLAIPVALHLAVTASGVLLLIPVVLKRRTGGLDRSHRSLAEKIDVAKGTWVTFRFERKPYNGRPGCEIQITAQTNAPAAPALPAKSIAELFAEYFRNRLIATEGHPVLEAAIARA